MSSTQTKVYTTYRNADRIHARRIFRGWVRPGTDPGFLVRGTMEGPNAPSELGVVDAKRRSAEGVEYKVGP